MDRGLKLQNLLTRKGDQILEEVNNVIRTFEEKEDIYSFLAIGIRLYVYQSKILFYWIMPCDSSDLHNVLFGKTQTPYSDRTLATNCIVNALLNSNKYDFDLKNGVTDYDYEDEQYTSIRFYF